MDLTLVFKRRDRRPFWRALAESIWPRGGWARAVQYIRHRIRRLPDTPEKISRGVAAGVFVSFTPFVGLHFITAAICALLIRGNIIASLIGTFVFNPLTILPIAGGSIALGHVLMGRGRRPDQVHTISESFSGAWADLRQNGRALFTHEKTDWRHLAEFFHDIFLPYIVGGIVLGALFALVSYFVVLPFVRAYQNSRRKKLRVKMQKLKPDNIQD